MDAVYRLLNGIDGSDGIEKVDGKWLKKAGAVKARQYSYICPEESCGIPMFAVFPTKPRGGGRVPECHFSSSWRQPHVGHGEPNHWSDQPDSNAKVYPPSDLPTKWSDRAPVKTAEENRKDLDAPESSVAVCAVSGSGSGRRGERSLSSFQRLVELWLEYSPSALPFSMAGSSGTTWGDFFLDLGCPEADRLGDRRVWLGIMKKLDVHGSWGVNLELLSLDGKRSYTAKFEFNDEQRRLRSDLWRMLIRNRKTNARVFLLGRRNFKEAKVRIELLDHFHLVE